MDRSLSLDAPSTGAQVAMTAEQMETHFAHHMGFVRRWRQLKRAGGFGGYRFESALARWYSCDISLLIEIPRGVVFMHNALGVVLSPTVRLTGPAVIFQHATIGESWSVPEGVPTIGSHVVVGAGARILGPITVGDGAVIGANAVVRRDVPPRTIVVGADRHLGQLDGTVHPNLSVGALTGP
jgi:serine O-acetyltransferase